MGLFSKLFNRGNKNNKVEEPEEYKSAKEFNSKIQQLNCADKYIARSDYEHLIGEYKDTYTFFDSSKRANTLSYYCKQNKLSEEDVLNFLVLYSDIADLRKGSSVFRKHNDSYISSHIVSEKAYLDSILHEIDSNILLDNEQRRVVLSDEDYTLIIAGAGAGKTTTVAAKVRYLVEKKHVSPSQILVISFTNKAVGELRERINTGLLIPCPITTFHSTGYAILRKQDVDKKKIVSDGFFFIAINNYLKGNILEQPDLVDKLIMFFGSYFDAPYEGNDINLFFNYVSKADFSTLKSNVNEYNAQVIDRRTNKVTTITNEVLRSVEEVEIANFLYLNGIDYVYEEIYPYHILKAKKPYTPDFCIRQGNKVAYIEHFGITESGHHSFYTPEQLAKYKQEIADKINLHKKHGTTLIYTYSKYNDGRDFLTHLKEQLESNGFVLSRRPSEEVYTKLVNTEENKYILRLVKLITTFISNFKVNGYSLDDFYRFERMNANVRTKLFFDICKACYLEYQKKLSEENAIDFQDMINDSARILREKQLSKEQLDFKYIIVDEYQDISRQRFDLTKELSKLCKAKIIAVGDDWQSIYAFSGSDITLFTHFCDIMGYGEELKITKTYRNAQEVIDIAGNFVQKNDSQIKKSLESPKHIQKPVIIQTYSESYDKKEYKGKGGKYYHLGKQLEDLIGKILEQNKKEGKSANSSILLIGRFNFDARNLCFSNDFVYDENNGKIFSKKYPRAKLEFLTAHSSKGLGYDNVIIVNARNELYGFPSKIDDDPVMKYVTKDDSSYEYAEERRLFYVAMTRTKNRVYILAPENRPSEFILELVNDYPNITVNGELNRDSKTDTGLMKKCPICGYPLLLRYKKNYGYKLWMCSNEPEICNFITNELVGGDMSIQKCDWCKDGYLVVKKTSNGAILGCTNYKPDGSGCGRRMSPEYYHRWLTNGFEEDLSTGKRAYQKENVYELPKIQESAVKTASQPRQKPQVHTVTYSKKFIEKDGFMVVADDDGQILTDMKLLEELRTLRARIAYKEKKPAYTIIGNKDLVSLATYRPESKEDYLSLYGLGESTYDAYGALFVKAIKDYEAKQ